MNTIGNYQRVTPDDPALQDIIGLDQLFFPRPWNPLMWQEIWKHHLLFKVECSGRLSGFALFSLVDGDDTAHLLKICVHPDWRVPDFTSQFWLYCLSQLKNEEARRVFLEVEESNLRAISFYLRQGFAQLHTIKGYYSDGAGACVMELVL
jgi:ribosomal protein S18 acetylase RimI-like enzyme